MLVVEGVWRRGVAVRSELTVMVEEKEKRPGNTWSYCYTISKPKKSAFCVRCSIHIGLFVTNTESCQPVFVYVFCCCIIQYSFYANAAAISAIARSHISQCPFFRISLLNSSGLRFEPLSSFFRFFLFSRLHYFIF